MLGSTRKTPLYSANKPREKQSLNRSSIPINIQSLEFGLFFRKQETSIIYSNIFGDSEVSDNFVISFYFILHISTPEHIQKYMTFTGPCIVMYSFNKTNEMH